MSCWAFAWFSLHVTVCLTKQTWCFILKVLCSLLKTWLENVNLLKYSYQFDRNTLRTACQHHKYSSLTSLSRANCLSQSVPNMSEIGRHRFSDNWPQLWAGFTALTWLPHKVLKLPKSMCCCVLGEGGWCLPDWQNCWVDASGRGLGQPTFFWLALGRLQWTTLDFIPAAAWKSCNSIFFLLPFGSYSWIKTS